MIGENYQHCTVHSTSNEVTFSRATFEISYVTLHTGVAIINSFEAAVITVVATGSENIILCVAVSWVEVTQTSVIHKR